MAAENKEKENERSSNFVDNMKLWSSVCETDPKITKRVNARGGFTAIDAQSQIKRATELFGPFGQYWGLRNFTYGLIGNNTGISLTADFFYPATDCDEAINTFPIASDMPYKLNDDCFKKLQTDCITKALSRLGFNSDVFEGWFDDSKYVAEMNKKFKNVPQEQEVDSVSYRAPNDLEKGIIRKVFDELTKMKVADGYVIDMPMLKKAIWVKFGRWPSKEESISKVLQVIAPADVTKKNDFPGTDANFVEGID